MVQIALHSLNTHDGFDSKAVEGLNIREAERTVLSGRAWWLSWKERVPPLGKGGGAREPTWMLSAEYTDMGY
jgi:hypothetical protein